MSKFKVGDIVTGKYENHWVYGFKWRIKSIEKGYDHLTYEDIDLYEVIGVDENNRELGLDAGAIWLESELELVKEEQKPTKQNTFKVKDIMDKLNIERGEYISDNGIEIEITEDTVILGNKHNEEFVIPIDFDDTFKENRKLTLDDFDLEEEFEVMDLEGIFKKVKIFDSVLIARKWNDGSVWTYPSSSYFKEDAVFVKINK